MSNLRLIPELFIGVPELGKLVKSLKGNGFITSNRALINNFGVAIHKHLPHSLRVIPGSSGKITVRAGIAIDSNFEHIIVEEDLVNVGVIPDNGSEYYIMIEHYGTVLEKGTVSISPDGTLTGVGTEFLSLFRGEGSRMPNKIRFEASDTSGPVMNQGEFYVSSVESDTLAYLNISEGILVQEDNIKFSVIGSFTPSVAVPLLQKNPYINDSYIISISQSDTSDGLTKFLLGSAVNTEGIVTIRDLRDRNLLSCYDNDATSVNPIIGVELVMYGSIGSGGLENPVQIGWGLESSQGSWSVDTSGEVVVSSVLGGKIASLEELDSIELKGWRVCFPDGKIGLILNTNLSLGVLKLQTTLTSNDVSGPLLIVPDCDSVEILCKNPTNNSIIRRVSFDSSMRYGIVPCESGVGIRVSFRLLKGNSRNSTFANIGSGSYYPETSFDDDGVLISSTKQSYSGGVIVTKRRENSIIQLFNSLIPIGAVIDFFGETEESIPDNYINCDGREVTNQNSPLYGFITPDYRGRASRGIDPEQSEYNQMGKHSGSKNVQLTIPQLPKHTPSVSVASAGSHVHTGWAAGPYIGPDISGGGGFDGGGNTFKQRPFSMDSAGEHTHSVTVGEIGGDQSHPNVGPSIAMFKIMRIL